MMCIYGYKLIFCKKVTFVEIGSYNLLALMGRNVTVILTKLFPFFRLIKFVFPKLCPFHEYELPLVIVLVRECIKYNSLPS